MIGSEQSNTQAVLTAAGRFALREAPVPEPRAGQALVRVSAVGVCGSDMHMFRTGRIGGIELPAGGLVPGHEAAGLVEAVGPGGDDTLLGRRVAIEPCLNCGVCHWCTTGQANVCPYHEFLGLDDRPGAMQQYILHPQRLCVEVDEHFSDDEIVLLEPLAIALHAIDRSGWRPGESALVLGAGPIGLCITLLLAHLGCERLMATDVLDYRLALARRLGATDAWNPRETDVVAEARQSVAEHGPRVVFEAAGEAETFEQMVGAASPGGVAAVVGIPEDDRLAVSHSAARRKGLDLRMIRRSNHTLTRVAAMAAGGRLPLSALVSHHWPLAQAQQAYETVAAYDDKVVKGIITPNAKVT